MTNRIYAETENTLTIDSSNLIISGDTTFNSALNLNAIHSEQINFLNKNFIKITDLSFNNTIKSIALSGNGERLAIGFPEDNNGQGLVKLYDLSDNKWHFLLDISSVNDIYDLSEYHGLVNEIQKNDRDNFGYSVSLNHKGDRLAVGAPNMLLYTQKIDEFSGGATDVSNVPYRFGAVYVYDLSDTEANLIKGYHQAQIEDQIDGLPSKNPTEYIDNSNIPTIIGNFTSGPLDFSGGQRLGDIVKLSSDGHRVAFTIKHGFNRNFVFDMGSTDFNSDIKNNETTGQVQVWDYSGNIFIPAYIDNNFSTSTTAEKIRNFGVPLVHDSSGTTGINSLALSGDSNTIVFGSTPNFIDPSANDFNDISSGILTGWRYNEPSFIPINEISFNEPGYNLGSQVDIDDSGNIIIYSTTNNSQGGVFILDICNQLQLTDHKITSEFKDYEITKSTYNNFGSSISLSNDGKKMFIADNCYNLIRRYNFYNNDFIIDNTIPTNENDNNYSNPKLITSNSLLDNISVVNLGNDPSNNINTYKLEEFKDRNNIYIDSNILPSKNNKYNLGSMQPEFIWDKIYGKSLHIDGVQYSHVPRGIIVMWSDSSNNVPVGWAICDGTNGTPDLRARFIVGVGIDSKNQNISYNLGDVSGQAEVTLQNEEMPSHTHHVEGYTDNMTKNSEHTHPAGSFYVQNTVQTSREYAGRSAADQDQFFRQTEDREVKGTSGNAEIEHQHYINVNTEDTGGSGSHENRPPYYALYYIMKL